MPRIAVDLNGGDGAPDVVVDGALAACGAESDLHLLLVGAEPDTDEAFGVFSRAGLADRVTLVPAHAAVAMTDPAVRGARAETSLSVAAVAVAKGRACAMVSAGSSGALVTAAVHAMGRSPGVRRPAMAACVPSAAGPVVLLDVGAGTDASVADLVSNAILGAMYAEAFAGISAARVALLSIGTETGKGDRLRRTAALALESAALPADARYVGCVEGCDVALGGPADVVVTDGFTGNVLLKGMEGAYVLAGGAASATPAPRAAALLGVRGTAVVCHGSATGADIASGILMGARLHRLAMDRRLTSGVPELSADAR